MKGVVVVERGGRCMLAGHSDNLGAAQYQEEQLRGEIERGRDVICQPSLP